MGDCSSRETWKFLTLFLKNAPQCCIVDAMKQLFHLHLLVKANVENPPMSEQLVEKWLTELVSDIEMKICIPPKARYVEVEGNRGVTGVVVIETSHCSIHVWDETNPGLIQMDVYSCSSFSAETVLNKLKEFGLKKHEYMIIDRNEGFKVIDHKIVE